MNLHEYQAKELFRRQGMPTSRGVVVSTADAAVEAVTNGDLGDTWVCKVQVHAGGRGKAGGVKVATSVDEVRRFAAQWLGQRIVTIQSGADGQPVDTVYIEEVIGIAQEFYLGAVIDRSTAQIVVMASAEGGVEIEKVAAETPEKIHQVHVDSAVGPQAYQGRELGFRLGLKGTQNREFADLFLKLVALFFEFDCSLVEINPLVVTEQGTLNCLDAKINLDDNALFRHPELAELRDVNQEDAREAAARQFSLNYVALDGNIGCMVNGAGLAMGTMDLVKLQGGSPANFLDVGGGVNQESVSEAFKIILADPEVKAVLINIFGGIVSCAVIAEGIVAAVHDVGVEVPVVVRFDGNNADRGRAVLADSGLNIVTSETLLAAAQSAVSAAQGASA